LFPYLLQLSGNMISKLAIATTCKFFINNKEIAIAKRQCILEDKAIQMETSSIAIFFIYNAGQRKERLTLLTCLPKIDVFAMW